MNAHDRKRLKYYFYRSARKPRLWTFALVATGIVVSIMSHTLIGRLLGIATIILAGIASLRGFMLTPLRDTRASGGPRRFMMSPSEAELDGWLKEELGVLESRALDKAGLDPSELVGDSVVVIAPQFRNLGGARFGFRLDRAGRARFTPIRVSIINFTEHQLVIYRCLFDLMTGNPLNESVDEFFYTDIVSVSTRSEQVIYALAELDKEVLSRVPKIARLAIDGKVQINNAEALIISTSGGNSMRIVLYEPTIVQGLGGDALSLELAEHAVQAIRKMLRDKKAGSLPFRGL